MDRPQETSYDVIVTKNKPRIVNLRTGERHVHSRSVDLGADESHENRKLLGCCTAEVSSHSEDLVSPCADPADKRVSPGGCEDIMSHDENIPTLNVDGEALEEEMECVLEDETVQDPGRARTISNPGQPSKEELEEHEATHAQYRSWCIARVRGR